MKKFYSLTHGIDLKLASPATPKETNEHFSLRFYGIAGYENDSHIAEKFHEYNQSESSQVNTFIHEVVHGVLDTMGEDKLAYNEKFVNTFSSLLVDVIEEIVKVNKEECTNDKSE